jgi:hypothetical protein
MEAKFFGKLKAEHIEGKWWKLIDGLGFYSKKYDLTIYIPTGFITDFASVPRLPLTYLIAGNTGHWEAIGHDMGYRWNQLNRKTHDNIFKEAGFVRTHMRERQNWFLNLNRKLRITLMTKCVRIFGCFSYIHKPGCLDYRNKCDKNCKICKNYYPFWKQCIMKGYHPEISKIHEEYLWNHIL